MHAGYFKIIPLQSLEMQKQRQLLLLTNEICNRDMNTTETTDRSVHRYMKFLQTHF